MTTDERAACPVHADFDPLSPSYLADPFAVLSALPREAPNISFRGPQTLWVRAR